MKYSLTNLLFRYFLLSILMILGASSMSFAQSELKDPIEINRRFKLAEKLYMEGKVDSVPRLLGEYLQNKSLLRAVSKNIRADIYRLGGLSYIMLDSLDQAERNIKNMLAYYYDYHHRDDDLLSFKAAVDTLVVTPLLMVGVRVGTNFSIASSQRAYSIFNFTQSVSIDETYTPTFNNFQVALIGEYALSKNLSVAIEPGLVKQGFSYEGIYNDLDLTYSYQQSISYLDFPVMAKYHFFAKSLYKPYIYGGGFYRYLTSSSKESGNSIITITPLLKQNNFGYIAGGGISRDLKRFNLSLDARYIGNLGIITNGKNRYLNTKQGDVDTFIYQYYDVMDDINIRNIAVSVSFIYYLSYKVF